MGRPALDMKRDESGFRSLARAGEFRQRGPPAPRTRRYSRGAL